MTGRSRDLEEAAFLLTGLYPNTFIMTTLSQVPKSDFAHSVCQYLTYEEVWSAVFLQEGVQMVPELRDPVENLEELLVACQVLLLVLVSLYSFTVQVPQQKPVGWFYVVGEHHHPVATCKKHLVSAWELNRVTECTSSSPLPTWSSGAARG